MNKKELGDKTCEACGVQGLEPTGETRLEPGPHVFDQGQRVSRIGRYRCSACGAEEDVYLGLIDAAE